MIAVQKNSFNSEKPNLNKKKIVQVTHSELDTKKCLLIKKIKNWEIIFKQHLAN